MGGVRSALLVNVGHGPLSGSADGTGRAALRVLPGPDGLLAMTVGAEAGAAGGAAGETGPSGRRNPDGLSDRGWSADAGDSAATVPSAGRESWPARSSSAPICTISSTCVSVGTRSDDRRADQMNKQAQNKADTLAVRNANRRTPAALTNTVAPRKPLITAPPMGTPARSPAAGGHQAPAREPPRAPR